MQACEDGDEGGGCGYGGLHHKMRRIKTGNGVYIDLAHFDEARYSRTDLEGIDSVLPFDRSCQYRQEGRSKYGRVFERHTMFNRT